MIEEIINSNPNYLDILDICYRNKNININELSKKMKMTYKSTFNLIKKLKSLGIVEIKKIDTTNIINIKNEEVRRIIKYRLFWENSLKDLMNNNDNYNQVEKILIYLKENKKVYFKELDTKFYTYKSNDKYIILLSLLKNLKFIQQNGDYIFLTKLGSKSLIKKN